MPAPRISTEIGTSPTWKPRSIAQVLFAVMLVAGCAARDDEHVYIADEDCTRLDAAVESSTVLFKAIPDMQKQAIEDCGRGDPYACISAPFAVPYTAFLAAVYAPMGFLIGLTFEDTQTALCEHARGARTAKPQKPEDHTEASILAQAKQGDPEAQHAIGSMSPSASDEKWTWFCRAANQSHGKAQARFGLYYENGIKPAERNYARAYMWYRLAESNGFKSAIYEGYDKPPKTRISVLGDKMTSTEIADGERLAAEWKPDPAACEDEGIAISSSN